MAEDAAESGARKRALLILEKEKPLCLTHSGFFAVRLS